MSAFHEFEVHTPDGAIIACEDAARVTQALRGQKHNAQVRINAANGAVIWIASDRWTDHTETTWTHHGDLTRLISDPDWKR